MSTPQDLNPLHTRTGRLIVAGWLHAVSDTFLLLALAARKTPKPDKKAIPAPTWYRSGVEK